MDAGQRQAVLTHVIDLGGGWRWTQRAYATRFQRNWYKADRAAGLSGDWVKLGAMLDGDGADSTVAEALSVFRDGEAGQVRLKANNRLYYSRGVETKTAWDGDWNGWRRFEASVRYHVDGMDRFQWVDNWTMVSGRLVDPVMGTPGTESNRIEWSRAVAGYARAAGPDADGVSFPGFGWSTFWPVAMITARRMWTALVLNCRPGAT